MWLHDVSITKVRNLHTTTLPFHPTFNMFFGHNGSGKTSLLEAVYLLGMGRSFRVQQARHVIRFDQRSCVVSAVLHRLVADKTVVTRFGVERFCSGEVKVRLSGKPCRSVSQLTRVLPLQLLNTDSFQVLCSGPHHRRQFLDWGLFHVEPSFFSVWRQFRRVLQQRNAELKRFSLRRAQKNAEMGARLWDHELSKVVEPIDAYRRCYLDRFVPVLQRLMVSLLNFKDEVVVHYKRGWRENVDFQGALEESMLMDAACGYTSKGPHRAEIEFLINKRPVEHVFSRGQLKLFVCAMFVARAHLLKASLGDAGIILVDDLSAELDPISSRAFVDALVPLQTQVFMTGISKEPLVQLMKEHERALFHVEQGRVVLQS